MRFMKPLSWPLTADNTASGGVSFLQAGRRCLAVSAIALALAGCNTPEPRPMREMPDRPAIGKEDTPNYSELQIPALHLDKMEGDFGSALPTRLVGPISAIDTSVVAVLDVLSSNQGIPMVVGPGVSDVNINLSIPGKMPFDQVVELISTNTGIYYTYANGVLKLEANRHFSINVPVFGDSLSNIQSGLSALGAEDVSGVENSGQMTFTSDRVTYAKVKGWLKQWFDLNYVIVYDAWFLEISLSDNNSIGINWEEFAVENLLGTGLDFATSSTGAVTEGLTFSLAGEKGDVSIESIVGFLRTQGNASVLSKPTISLVSGTEAKMHVGGKQQYISSVDRTTTDGVVSTSTTPAEITTGLDITLEGSYADGMVHTKLTLTQNELVRFETFDTGDETLRLPITADRNLTNEAHSRPGDVIMFGGLIADRTDIGTQMTAIGGIPLGHNETQTRSELVIMLRPRVVKFRPAAE